MRLLLDTHILLWALAASDRLPQDARTWLESEENVVLFSAASIWEIAIKAQVRRPDFDADPLRIAAEARAAAFIELPVRAHHAAAVAQLPLHHPDPFDRLLVAQAMTEPARLITIDGALALYSKQVIVL